MTTNLDAYRDRLNDAGWMIEPGDSIQPGQSAGDKVLWMARKNGVTLIVGDKTVSVARGTTRASMPVDIVLNGHILLPGAMSEKYLAVRVGASDLIPHEGKMTDEELELRALLG
jgi:hypothetical protein